MKHLCSCVDISPRGIAIDCPEALAPESQVAIVADEQGVRRMARVCYCNPQGAGHRIGLEFVAVNSQPASGVTSPFPTSSIIEE
jgi:hypothetical protein